MMKLYCLLFINNFENWTPQYWKSLFFCLNSELFFLTKHKLNKKAKSISDQIMYNYVLNYLETYYIDNINMYNIKRYDCY